MYRGLVFFFSSISAWRLARILFAMAVPSILTAAMVGLDVEKCAWWRPKTKGDGEKDVVAEEARDATRLGGTSLLAGAAKFLRGVPAARAGVAEWADLQNLLPAEASSEPLRADGADVRP